MADTVLITGSSPDPALSEALAARDFEARLATLDALGEALAGVSAIALCEPTAATLAQTVAQLAKNPAVAGLPVVVVFSTPDAALRDQCLIAGAHDVSLTGHPDDVAARIDGAVHGWIRSEPKRAIKAVFKAQRGKQLYELKVVDIDPTGFTMAAVAELSDGHLLRVTMGLPDGALVAWGRVAAADGVPGVRLVALAPDDRARIVNAVKGKPAAKTADTKPVSTAPVATIGSKPVTASMRAVSAAPTDTQRAPDPTGTTASMRAPGGKTEQPAPLPSVIVSPPSASLEPAPANGSSPPVASLQVPPAMRPKSNPPRASTRPAAAHPTPVMSTRLNAPTGSPAPSSLGQTVSMRAITTAQVEAATAPAPPAAPAPVAPPEPAASPAPAQSISDAIGSLLGDEPAPAAVPDGAAPEAAAEQIADVRFWPSTPIDPAAALAVLREAVVRGITAEAPGAPSPVMTVAFLRTLAPLEKRAFDEQPPSDLPDPPMSTNALAMRLRLYALTQEAVSATAELATGATFLIDEETLTKIAADVNAASAEMQKVMDGLMTSGQPQRMKQINAFRNTVTKAHSDLRAAVDALRGQQASHGNMALMDVATDAPDAPKPDAVAVKREAPKTEAKAEPKNEYAVQKEDTPKRRERRVMVIGGALALALGITAFALYPRKPAPISAAELASLPDIVRASIAGKRCMYIANGVWVADENHMKSIDALQKAHALKSYTVMTEKSELLVASGEKGPSVLPMAKLPRVKK